MADLFRKLVTLERLEAAAQDDSPVHRLHTGVKWLTTLCFVVLVVSLPTENPAACLPFLAYPVFLTAASGTPLRYLGKRLAVALPFSLMGGLSRLFFYRETAFIWGGFAVSTGLLSFTTILLKTGLTVWAALLLAATATWPALVGQLAAFGLPKTFCLSLEMTGRYASVLLTEAASLRTAYTLRAGQRRGLAFGHAGVMLGQWLLRGFDRAERIHRAMQCRGWQQGYTGIKTPYRPADLIYLGLVSGGLLLLRWGMMR